MDVQGPFPGVEQPKHRANLLDTQRPSGLAFLVVQDQARQVLVQHQGYPPGPGLVADRYGLVAVFYCLAGIMLFANVLVVLIPKRAA